MLSEQRSACDGATAEQGPHAVAPRALTEKRKPTMPHTNGPRFGIATAPQQVSYDDILRVWREADAIPEIEHAWHRRRLPAHHPRTARSVP